MRPTPVSVETLLQHRAWMRDLARTLVRDEHAADDVEQEAWEAALRAPPREGNVRGWLATVLRNAARKRTRSETRRAYHERWPGVPGDVPPVSETVARAETHRRLVDAVMALPDVQRDAVLLRYFDGLPPREVARRTGVPVATVRTRLRRALLTLRERLDASYGDRDAWRPALLLLVGADLPPVGGPAGASGATSIGATAMATTVQKMVAAAGVVLLGAALWWALSSEDRPDAPGPEDIASSADPIDPGAGADDASTPRRPRKDRASGSAATAGPENPDEPAPDEAAEGPVFRVDLTRADGGPLEGARLMFALEDRVTWSAYVEDGEVPAGPVPAEDGKLVVAVDGVTVQAMPVRAGTEDVKFTLRTDVLLEGLLRIDGAAPGRRMILALRPERMATEAEIAAPEAVPHCAWVALQSHGYAAYAECVIVTDDGRLRLVGKLPRGSHWAYYPSGFVDRTTRDNGARVDLPDRNATFDLIRLPMVSGRVVDSDGKPVPHAQVEAYYGTESGGGGTGTEADENGVFEIPLPVDETVKGECTITDPDGVVTRTFPFSLQPGGSHAFGDLALPAIRTLRLRVLDPDDKPLAGAVGMAPAEGGIAEPGAPSTADGLVTVAAAGTPETVFVAAPGHALFAVAGARLVEGEVLDVRLARATRVTVRPAATIEKSGWTLHVTFPAGTFGVSASGSPADDAALALHAVSGASRFGGGMFGGESARATFRLVPGEPVVLVGARAGAELVLDLHDAEGRSRGTTRVRLGAAEQRTVELRAEPPR